MKANEAGKTYDVVIVCSAGWNPGYILVNNKDYPQIADDYVGSFTTLRNFHAMSSLVRTADSTISPESTRKSGLAVPIRSSITTVIWRTLTTRKNPLTQNWHGRRPCRTSDNDPLREFDGRTSPRRSPCRLDRQGGASRAARPIADFYSP